MLPNATLESRAETEGRHAWRPDELKDIYRPIAGVIGKFERLLEMFLLHRFLRRRIDPPLKSKPLGCSRRMSCALRKVMLIESLPQQRFDDCLPAHI